MTLVWLLEHCLTSFYMDISIQNLGKRYNREWIFRNLSAEIASGSKTAIIGANGSGKSTLLKILGFYALQSEGQVTLLKNGVPLISDDLQLHINFAAPYFNVIEEYTLSEFFEFHTKFKKPIVAIEETLNAVGLTKAQNKQIKDFSSGMKQRVKLILALGFDSDLIFLDEPTSNLDEEGIEWFEHTITHIKGKTVLIATNLKHEIALCEEEILLKNFKTSTIR